MTTFRFTTAGESHGPGLVAIVEGMPAGLELDREALDRDMARRQLGHGRGGRMKIETDTVEVRSGVRHGRTLGSPIALLVANRDYANWEERMNPWPVEGFEPDEVHLPRPGPRRPRRRPEIRPRRHPQRARARQRPRDRRPRRRRHARPRLPHRARGRGPQPRPADRLGPGARSAPTSARRTSPRSTRTRSAASTPRRARRWSTRSTACARPTRASAAPSRC